MPARTLLRIGDLASRTGLTVRTLHHYDDLGLLRPTERTAAGHRRYGQETIARLQQIVSLRALGLPLHDIADLLDRPNADPVAIIERHRAALSAEIAEAEHLRERLDRVATHFRTVGSPTTEDLLTTIHLTVMFEKHYTPDQLQTLKEREAALGPEQIESVQRDWADLFASFDQHRQSGTAPEAAELAPLVERARELIGAFTGGDPGIRASLNQAVADNKDQMPEAWGISPETNAYYFAAMGAHGGA